MAIKRNFRDKHDWPIINIQPSSDGTKVLTHTYSRPRVNCTTCWEKNNNGEWHIAKRTRQQNPTRIAASFNQINDSNNTFVQMYNNHAQLPFARYIKQFRSNGTSYSKARKLTITSDVSPAFAYEYEWKTNSTPFIWLTNDEVAIGNKVFLLTPSLEYGFCQKALDTLLSKKRTSKKDYNRSEESSKFGNRIKTFLTTNAFKKLSPDEQRRLKNCIRESEKFQRKTGHLPSDILD